MEYTICVDGKYFVGETMEPIDGHAIAVSGFFQMVGNNNYLTAYEFSEDITKADKMILFNALGYLEGIHERTRHLKEDQKPKKIVIERVGSCSQCKGLYVKDFVTGVCETPNSGRSIVSPNDCCDRYEGR